MQNLKKMHFPYNNLPAGVFFQNSNPLPSNGHDGGPGKFSVKYINRMYLFKGGIRKINVKTVIINRNIFN